MDIREPSDEELLRRLRAGDEAAFTALYRRRQGGVYRFALQMSGSEAIAEDVTQEVFLALMREGNSYNPKRGSVAAYMYGIARKQVLRSLSRIRSETDAACLAAVAQPGSDPLSSLTHRESLAAVRRAVLALPERYREVAVLCEFHSEMSIEAGIAGQVVKGAPFSAEAMSESTQMLYDGNRIQRKTTATLYRDSQGRTRREQTLAALGPWAAAEPLRTIIITDPVAGVTYVLDPSTRTASKLPLGKPEVFLGASMAGVPGGVGGGVGHGVAGGVGGGAVEKIIEIGKRMIEGVEAEGTRSTMVIAAGQIGNDRPIETVTERWYSPQLQTVVYSKRTDPMSGETVYRLTGINRGEPSPGLFHVPADHTLKESPAHSKTQRDF